MSSIELTRDTFTGPSNSRRDREEDDTEGAELELDKAVAELELARIARELEMAASTMGILALDNATLEDGVITLDNGTALLEDIKALELVVTLLDEALATLELELVMAMLEEDTLALELDRAKLDNAALEGNRIAELETAITEEDAGSAEDLGAASRSKISVAKTAEVNKAINRAVRMG